MKKCEIEEWIYILKEGDIQYRCRRPTLYDLMIHNYIDFINKHGTEMDLINPNEKFQIKET